MWIEELSNGKYKYTERYKDPYTEKHKRVSITLSSKSKQAQKQAQKKLDLKINHMIDKKESKNITFFEVFNEWFEQHKKSVRPSSIRAYNSQKKIIQHKINSDILIRNIDTKYMQKFFNELEYSDEYISSIKSLLNKMFKYALKMQYITYNPMTNVEIIKKAKTFEDIQQIENKYLEKVDAEKLISELYLRKSTYRLGRLAEFMYLTGVRIGEAVILKKSDFDLANNLVNITGTIDISNGYKKAMKGPTKTIKGTRKILLTSRCKSLVERTIEENKICELSCEHSSVDSFLFSTKSGTPIQTNSFNLSLKRAGNKIGLSNKRLSSHIFRHSHVSILAEMNIPLKAIMDRVGHEDSDTTNKIYTHVTSNMKLNIVHQLEETGL